MNQKNKLLYALSLSILLSSCAKPTISTEQSPMTLPYVSVPSTSNKMALRIADQLPVYAAAAKMQWSPIQAHVPLKIGAYYSVIPVIRERLIALQDLPAEYGTKSSVYDASLVQAVSAFQFQNGLKATGVINQDTLNALNISPAQRYRELVQSMNAWAQLPEDAHSRYIQVNIPSYEMHIEQQGQDVLQMRVIVGKPLRPTPVLESTVTTLVFNPSWNVPETILSKDVIPGMRENPNYLNEHYGMKIYSTWDKEAREINPSSIDWQTETAKHFKYRVTAPPSDRNPLGRVKFIFANDRDVYMHDTPEKSLFDLTDRARSSGCIRLQYPMALVEYFYSDNKDLNAELTNQYLSTFETKYIALKNAMPIYITYILAWVGPHGHAHFAKDIYHHDA